MKYYVKVILENGLISQDIDVFSTMEEAKMFKNLAEKAGNKAEIYEIELIPAELEKLHEYKIVSKLSVEKLQEQLNTAKKYIEESYKADKEDNKLLDLIIEDVAKLKSDNEILKKALTEIASTRQWRGGTLVGFEATEDAQIAINALAAIGWYGCPVGSIGKNGLTKEELEGSGDE